MDCVTAKKRMEQCDAECPGGQSESSTVGGHEVRVPHPGLAGGWAASLPPAAEWFLFFVALIVNVDLFLLLFLLLDSRGTDHSCYETTLLLVMTKTGQS